MSGIYQLITSNANKTKHTIVLNKQANVSLWFLLLLTNLI